MAISTTIIPRFIEEFRSIKLESLKKDLHKLTPDELDLIKQELEYIIRNSRTGDQHD